MIYQEYITRFGNVKYIFGIIDGDIKIEYYRGQNDACWIKIPKEETLITSRNYCNFVRELSNEELFLELL